MANEILSSAAKLAATKTILNFDPVQYRADPEGYAKASLMAFTTALSGKEFSYKPTVDTITAPAMDEFDSVFKAQYGKERSYQSAYEELHNYYSINRGGGKGKTLQHKLNYDANYTEISKEDGKLLQKMLQKKQAIPMMWDAEPAEARAWREQKQEEYNAEYDALPTGIRQRLDMMNEKQALQRKIDSRSGMADKGLTPEEIDKFNLLGMGDDDFEKRAKAGRATTAWDHFRFGVYDTGAKMALGASHTVDAEEATRQLKRMQEMDSAVQSTLPEADNVFESLGYGALGSVPFIASGFAPGGIMMYGKGELLKSYYEATESTPKDLTDEQRFALDVGGTVIGYGYAQIEKLGRFAGLQGKGKGVAHSAAQKFKSKGFGKLATAGTRYGIDLALESLEEALQKILISSGTKIAQGDIPNIIEEIKGGAKAFVDSIPAVIGLTLFGGGINRLEKVNASKQIRNQLIANGVTADKATDIANRIVQSENDEERKALQKEAMIATLRGQAKVNTIANVLENRKDNRPDIGILTPTQAKQYGEIFTDEEIDETIEDGEAKEDFKKAIRGDENALQRHNERAAGQHETEEEKREVSAIDELSGESLAIYDADADTFIFEEMTENELAGYVADTLILGGSLSDAVKKEINKRFNKENINAFRRITYDLMGEKKANADAVLTKAPTGLKFKANVVSDYAISFYEKAMDKLDAAITNLFRYLAENEIEKESPGSAYRRAEKVRKEIQGAVMRGDTDLVIRKLAELKISPAGIFGMQILNATGMARLSAKIAERERMAENPLMKGDTAEGVDTVETESKQSESKAVTLENLATALNIPQEQAQALYSVLEAMKFPFDRVSLVRDESGEVRIVSGKDTLAQLSSSDFYSPLQRVVEGLKQETFLTKQLAGIVKNAPGIKSEELADIGFYDWLDGVEGKVTKEQALSFIENNGPQIEKVEKGVSKEEDKAKEARFIALNQRQRFVTNNPLSDEELAEYFVLRDIYGEEAQGGGEWSSAKFSHYQLPGGKNYREVLLTLPVDQTSERSAIKERIDELTRRRDEILAQIETAPIFERAELRRNLANTDRQLSMVLSEDHRKGDRTAYKSSHWDEANVLAHVRLNDRTGPNGEKILFVEEIQSDWHQAGRKKGYNKGFPLARYEELALKNDKTEAEIEEFDNLFAAKHSGQIGKLGVPDAPFKKSWAMLAFKRVLRMAAEQGYDSVAWTPGEVQAERYDLSKQISELNYWKDEDGEYGVSLVGINDRPIDGWNPKEGMSESELEDQIGKELTKRIVNNEGDEHSSEPNVKVIRGEGLKVGGEGMKGFYDNILPKEVQKYVGKMGGTVETVEISQSDKTHIVWDKEAKRFVGQDGLSKQDAESLVARDPSRYVMERKDGTKVWNLPITDVMRSEVMKGQPLYQKAKGMVQFKEAEALITAFKSSDLSTGLHEVAHIARRFMFSAEADPAIKMSSEDIALTEKEYGVKDGKWTKKQEEAFADDFVRYMQTEKAPTPKLQSVFQKIAAWLAEIYGEIKKLVSPEMVGVFDRMLTRNPELVQKKAPTSFVSQEERTARENAEALAKSFYAQLDINITDNERLMRYFAARQRYGRIEDNSPELYNGLTDAEKNFVEQWDELAGDIAERLLAIKDIIRIDFRAIPLGYFPMYHSITDAKERSGQSLIDEAFYIHTGRDSGVSFDGVIKDADIQVKKYLWGAAKLLAVGEEIVSARNLLPIQDIADAVTKIDEGQELTDADKNALVQLDHYRKLERAGENVGIAGSFIAKREFYQLVKQFSEGTDSGAGQKFFDVFHAVTHMDGVDRRKRDKNGNLFGAHTKFWHDTVMRAAADFKSLGKDDRADITEFTLKAGISKLELIKLDKFLYKVFFKSDRRKLAEVVFSKRLLMGMFDCSERDAEFVQFYHKKMLRIASIRADFPEVSSDMQDIKRNQRRRFHELKQSVELGIATIEEIQEYKTFGASTGAHKAGVMRKIARWAFEQDAIDKQSFFSAYDSVSGAAFRNATYGPAIEKIHSVAMALDLLGQKNNANWWRIRADNHLKGDMFAREDRALTVAAEIILKLKGAVQLEGIKKTIKKEKDDAKRERGEKVDTLDEEELPVNKSIDVLVGYDPDRIKAAMVDNMNMIHKARINAFLGLNFAWVVITQPASYAITFGKTGKYANKAIIDRIFNAIKGKDQGTSESLVTKIKSGSAEKTSDVFATGEFEEQSLRPRLRKTVRNIGAMIPQLVEYELTALSYKAGYMYAKEKLNLSDSEAVIYGDYIAATSQTMYDRASRNSVLNLNILRFFQFFQSFALTMFGNIGEVAGFTGIKGSRFNNALSIFRYVLAAQMWDYLWSLFYGDDLDKALLDPDVNKSTVGGVVPFFGGVIDDAIDAMNPYKENTVMFSNVPIVKFAREFRRVAEGLINEKENAVPEAKIFIAKYVLPILGIQGTRLMENAIEYNIAKKSHYEYEDIAGRTTDKIEGFLGFSRRDYRTGLGAILFGKAAVTDDTSIEEEDE